MARLLVFAVTILICNICVLIIESSATDEDNDNFQITRIEPGNELGITTKIIAHIHRPESKLTETWRLNRKFTPTEVITTLKSMCSETLIERRIKWSNCELNSNGLTAELTYGIPEPKNKTLQYLEMKYEPFERVENGKRKICHLEIVPENPAYFLVETFSKVPSNNSFPRTPEESVETVHQHQLGKFGPEFLSIYGDSIDQDGIYNFDKDDYYEREEPYECLLSIGSSESASVIEQKCPIKCKISAGNDDSAKTSKGKLEEATIHSEL